VASAAGDPNPTTALLRLINGYQVSQAIHVIAMLFIADLLRDGPRKSEDIAAATDTHADSLYRLLRAVASVDVLEEGDDRTFSLTAIGEGLRSDAPRSLSGWAAYVGRPYYWNAWAHLLDGVETGELPFNQIYGCDIWEYRATRPDESAIFDRAMTTLTGAVNDALFAAFDFGRFRMIVDVGGGNGTLLAGILGAHPGSEGILFDQPHVVVHAEEVLRSAGVASRCRVVGGSFFDGVPEGGDAYVLKAVIHDWADAEAVAILGSCRAAMRSDALLILVERLLAGPNKDPITKFSDLNMLVAAGGRERTLEQFGALVDAAGFRLQGHTPTATGFNVIEAAPV
jgi:hypothetical protein